MTEVVSNNQAFIRACNLCKHYETFAKNYITVLRDVTFDIVRNMRVVITGESGSGKTTLLSMLSGLDTCSEGSAYIGDVEISVLSERNRAAFRRVSIGFVFQYHYLLQDFSALDNVMLPLMMNGVRKKDAREQAFEMMRKVGLENRVHHKSAYLSGGECQRIAIARALIHKPAVVFADEPTGSLDTYNSNMVRDLLCELVSTANATLIIATHDMRFLSIADMHVPLKDGSILNDNNSTNDLACIK